MLSEAHQRGLIQREGKGRRSDPFRYYLPEKVTEWQTDPLYEIRRRVMKPFEFPLDLQRRAKNDLEHADKN